MGSGVQIPTCIFDRYRFKIRDVIGLDSDRVHQNLNSI
uniref:Uncharacterized protein n=1 Tax=Nelumbo nucifera TaxID=4432 RepID=A0A822XZ93_NELNU|nr:TPA_asm: hypothetical protein HUJ06_025588 [Nelumbo nucifera]